MEKLLLLLILGFVLVILLLLCHIKNIEEQQEQKINRVVSRIEQANSDRFIDVRRIWEYVYDDEFADYIPSPYFSNHAAMPKSIIGFLENAGFVRDESRINRPEQSVADKMRVVAGLCQWCGRAPGEGDQCEHCGASVADYRVWK